jgi:hypothetical protein
VLCAEHCESCTTHSQVQRLLLLSPAENLVHRGDPRAQPGLLLDYLTHKLNSTQVTCINRLAAKSNEVARKEWVCM